MPRATKLFSILALLCALSATYSCNSGQYVQFRGYAQGGEYSVKVDLSSAKVPPAGLKAGIDSILNEIDFTLSGYNRGSLLSRLNRGETVVLNAVFCELYAISYDFWQRSGGAFDIAAGPLFDIWGFGFTGSSIPDPGDVESLLDRCGMGRLKSPGEVSAMLGREVSAADFLIRPDSVPPVLNFNAVAQGYSCDAVASYLHSAGCTGGMLVDIGEIYCEGLNPYGKPWNIGIDRPVDGNDTPGKDLAGIWSSGGRACGIVTSGNYRKFHIRDGKKYSHTIDPRTGYPVEHSLLSATVVAPDAASADAIATWCMVIGPQQARDLVASMPDVEACLICSDEVWMSENFL